MGSPNATSAALTAAATSSGRDAALIAGVPPEPSELSADPAGARLAAIVHLDMAGFSRLMELDEAGTLARLQDAFEAVLRPLAARAGGRLANTAGDSALLVFPGAGTAVRFALAFQQAVAERERGLPAERALRFRVGVTIADVLETSGADVYGGGVNIAARLQAACPPGGVCVAQGVRDQAQGKLGASFEPLGPLQLKNIARPVEAYLVRSQEHTIERSRWQDVAGRIRRSLRARGWAVLAALTLLGGGVEIWRSQRPDSAPAAIQLAAPAAAAALPDLSVQHAPRLSLVVLPFANISGDPAQDYLADAVTDDLTTDLSRLGGAFVIGRGSAQTYRGRASDARRVGSDLGVRYLVQGSVRRVGEGVVRVNAELVSTETGEGLWAERFDQEVRDLGQGQGDIVRRLAIALGTRLVNAEARRSERDHPDDPDAFDLVLRARSLLTGPTQRARVFAAEGLYERALEREPGSVTAMTGLAFVLIQEDVFLREGRPDNLSRSERLLAVAETASPTSPSVIKLHARLRRAQGRWEEAIAGYQQVIEADPNAVAAYGQIGICRLKLGQPEAAMPMFREAIRRDPREPDIWTHYNGMGSALLYLKQPADAAVWLRRALDAHPERDERSALFTRIALTSALAHNGQVEAARRELLGVVRLAPFLTSRSYEMRSPRTSPIAAQNLYVAEGLRLAGLRDHVDEDADAGVASTGELHQELFGPTPTSVRGGQLVRTDALQRLLAEDHPLVLDGNATGRSLPGAVVLGDSFTGGNLDDDKQQRLRLKVQALTMGDLARPIVALGWNAERWGSRNLALRLVALGYTRVYWYRAGKEVWEASGLPETEVEKTEW